MNRVIRRNQIDLPYSLHDGKVIGFQVTNDTLQMQLQSGFIETIEPFEQAAGCIEFEKIDWDFSYVYLLEYEDVPCGNCGSFTGKKMDLHEFIGQYHNVGFDIMDETYGYNMSKFSGYLSAEGSVKECIIEIYHLGDMSYIVEESF